MSPPRQSRLLDGWTGPRAGGRSRAVRDALCDTAGVAELHARWRRDLGLLSLDLDPGTARAVADDLLLRWGEAHRRYHTLQHLTEMFQALDHLADVGELGTREGALARVAAWFHDAVYLIADPGPSERASAELAVRDLPRLGVHPADVDRVTGLVLDTVAHDVPVGDPLAEAFHDADLWVLAAPAARFDEYCLQVREEYLAVPDEVYAHGRTAVLRPLLARPDVYATRYARRAWTAAARGNLTRELDRLAG